MNTMSNESRISRAIKPVTDLVILNAETTGTILLRQNALFNDMIAASVDQVKTLTTVGSLRDAVDAQRAYLREMGSKVRSTTRENVETIRGASQDAGDVVKGVFRRARKDTAEGVEQAAGQVADAVENAGEQVSSYVENAGDQASSYVQPAPQAPAPQQFGPSA